MLNNQTKRVMKNLENLKREVEENTLSTIYSKEDVINLLNRVERIVEQRIIETYNFNKAIKSFKDDVFNNGLEMEDRLNGCPVKGTFENGHYEFNVTFDNQTFYNNISDLMDSHGLHERE
jgi:hypothetical protein